MDLPVSRRYDVIGQGYAGQRRPDPRISALVVQALAGANRVLNVGAGAGSYEPDVPRLVALDPSLAMLRQRPAAAAPAVRGVAEHLPFADRAFDAVMGVLTVHHWPDWAAGMRECARVAPRRVFLVYDPEVSMRFWLIARYLPELAAAEEGRPSSLDVARVLGAHTIVPVLVPHDCTDGFLGAYWRRPTAYLDPEVRKAISSFRTVPEAGLLDGLDHLRTDIESGEWDRRYASLYDHETIDLGYRLVVSG